MERVEYLEGALSLPRLGAGHVIRHATTTTAVLGRPTGSWEPACMSAGEYRGWQAANALAGTFRAGRPCADCPLAWRMQQEEAGRCNGSP